MTKQTGKSKVAVQIKLVAMRTILCSTFNRHGFSLTAVIVTLTLLSLFGAVTLSNFFPLWQNNLTRQTLNQLTQLRQAIKMYQLDNGGSVPATLSELTSRDNSNCRVITNPASPNYRKRVGLCGPYLELPFVQQAPNYQEDSWGNTIQFNGSQLRSCGPNKICGDSDDLIQNL